MMVARKNLPPDQRRAAFIAAARELFAAKGVEATAVSDIVKAVGVAQGTFYWYFPSKDDILNAVVQEIADEICADLLSLAGEPEVGALQKAARMCDLFLARLRSEQVLFVHFHEPEHRVFHDRMVAEVLRRLLPAVRAVVRQGVMEGVFTTAHPDEAAALSLAAIWALDDRALVGGDEAAARWIEIYLEFVMNGLGCRLSLPRDGG